MRTQALPPDRELNRELQIVEYPSFEKLRSFAGHSTAVFHMCLDRTGRSASCAATSSQPLQLTQQNPMWQDAASAAVQSRGQCPCCNSDCLRGTYSEVKLSSPCVTLFCLLRCNLVTVTTTSADATEYYVAASAVVQSRGPCPRCNSIHLSISNLPRMHMQKGQLSLPCVRLF